MEAFISLLMSTLRVSTPLIFTGMGGMMSERSGVINIALEGFMLIGAFAGAAAAVHTGSPWIASLVGVGAGMIFAAIYGFFVIEMKADQIVAGTAMNLFAFGLTPLLTKVLFDSTGQTPALDVSQRFGNQPMFVAFLLVFALHYWQKNSRIGLWWKFAGEHPEALSTAGIRVKPVRWFSVILSGAFAAMGGVSLSIFLSSSFSRGMTAGRGFMALAAVIFGSWKPIPTLLACLFFGFTDALQIRLQGVVLFGSEPVAVQFIQIFPYVVTVLVLAGFMGKSRPPKSLGAPWILILAVLGLGAATSACSSEKSSELDSPRARIAKVNGELFSEMVRVVFQQEKFQNLDLYTSYVNTLNQGASLQGVYNGLAHSSTFRARENEQKALSEKSLDFLASELAHVQLEMKDPLRLDEKSAAPLAPVDFPTGSLNGKDVETKRSAGKPALPSLKPIELSKKYAALFRPASPFTLARVVSDATLKRAGEVSDLELGRWYGELCNRYAETGTDFGLKPRNDASVEFHEKWFKNLVASSGVNVARDRLAWEVVNRIHRVAHSKHVASAMNEKGESK